VVFRTKKHAKKEKINIKNMVEVAATIPLILSH